MFNVLTEGKRMNIVTKALAIAAMVLVSFSASASLMNVGGVVWDKDDASDFSGVSGVIYQEIDLGTGALSGYGRVTSLNGEGSASLCPSCELTFHFGGFTPSVVDEALSVDTEYAGGWMKFWVDDSPDAPEFDALDLTALNTGSDGGNNTLWLELAGHTMAGAETTFVGGTNLAGFPAGFGTLDVVGGLASWHINTNTMLVGNQTYADIVFGSSFTNFGVVLGVDDVPMKLWGTGSADFRGDSIPEPATLGIFGLGLIALAFGVRNRKV